MCPTALNILFACAAFGQSKFELANHHGTVVDAPVFDSQGVPLAGPTYRAELWGAANPTTLSPLVLIDRGNSREIVPFVAPGYFIPTSSSDNLCVLSVLPAAFAWLQVRAWDARLGATFEDAAARGLGGYGESALFYARGTDPFAIPPELPGPLIGLQSFSLLPEVPEPSTWTLLVSGLGLLWFTQRRRPRSNSILTSSSVAQPTMTGHGPTEFG